MTYNAQFTPLLPNAHLPSPALGPCFSYLLESNSPEKRPRAAAEVEDFDPPSCPSVGTLSELDRESLLDLSRGRGALAMSRPARGKADQSGRAGDVAAQR